MDTSKEKERQIRCPRLGGPVPFSYCDTMGENGKPCFKIADCWWSHFDVMGYLKKRLTAEELNDLLGRRPPPKLNSILDLIQQARHNARSDEKE